MTGWTRKAPLALAALILVMANVLTGRLSLWPGRVSRNGALFSR